MDYQINKLATENAVVGEGPLWVDSEQLLYWTDIRTGRCFRYSPATGENDTIHRGVFVGGLTVNRPGGLVFGTWEGVMLWRSDEDWQWYHHDEERGELMRFNDCKAGPDGSFYGGTAFDEKPTGGKLFRFFPRGGFEVVADGLGISNGMGWAPDLTVYYHTNSSTRTIYRHDYDPEFHTVSNRHPFIVLDDSMGVPDGMTVDAEGFIWSAVWGSGCVLRFDPDGKLERKIDLPATQTSSVMFGGKNFTDIYVTSANNGTGGKPSGHEPKGYDFSAHRGGELYCIRQDSVQGKPEFDAALPWPNG